jgi:fibronectin type 3 domain-containing protein
VDPRQFNPRAELLEKVSGAQLTAATLGDRLEIHRPVADLREGLALTYGVRFLDKSGERSAFSNLVTFSLATPPVAPTGLALDPSAEGVTVRWTPGADGVGGYRIYRRFAEERYYALPIATLGSGDKASYLDRGVSLDRRYVYTVTAVSSQSIATESPLGAEREIDYRDRFAPSPPTSLVALAEPGQVRLSWEPGSIDSRSYHVWQRDSPEGDFRRLTDQPVSETRFAISSAEAGRAYGFKVSALDELGNESSPCAEVEIVAQ